ncbi:sensor histidine kinase [Arthrobacter sp. H14]|uniref:sensor histidine kinase n=1 Tax=Arthrobacter sp. H14 TaxID=1312959 RepID=UPI0004B08D0E|nr:histidine kinase [Arthrobacter sp. H14]
MPISAAELLVIAAVVLAAVVVVLAIGFKLSRPRDLGSDADQATYRTLHTAALASKYLRQGLDPEGAAKASRHLRTLLACEALTLTDESAQLAWDGPGDANPDAAMRLAGKVLSTGRTQVFRKGDLQAAGPAGRGAAGPDPQSPLREAVFSPIQVGPRVVGTVGAYAPHVGAGLIRAANEVAAWVSTQVELADLDSSKNQLIEAEVRALRAQISPHFIYNSLNAIASFIHTDPARARELVVEFADFTRYSFRRHGDFTTLAEELKAIDRYLLLERARFGERLQVSLQIGPEVLSTVVPYLSLQPLVENAVRHGLERKDGVGHIEIKAHDAGPHAEVTIEDDGVGMDPEHLRSVLAGHAAGDHVGLRNVDSRLRQVYGDDHGLVVDTAPGAGTLITLRVPKFQPDHQP